MAGVAVQPHAKGLEAARGWRERQRQLHKAGAVLVQALHAKEFLGPDSERGTETGFSLEESPSGWVLSVSRDTTSRFVTVEQMQPQRAIPVIMQHYNEDRLPVKSATFASVPDMGRDQYLLRRPGYYSYLRLTSVEGRPYQFELEEAGSPEEIHLVSKSDLVRDDPLILSFCALSRARLSPELEAARAQSA